MRALGAVGAVSVVGAGGAGGRAGAATEHFFLSLGGASVFFGGKADMWAVRAVGMEAAVGVVGAVWVVWGGVGGDYRTPDS